MISKLPTKLGKEPLIDAIFEMRFEADAPVSEIVPGALFSEIGSKYKIGKIERLAPAEMPRSLREQDDNLRYAPLIRLHLDQYIIAIGDHVFSVACKLPYPMWKNFKPAILEFVGCLNKFGIIKNMQRFSLKYVNIIPEEDISKQITKTTLHISLSNRKISEQQFSFRVEFKESKALHIIHILAGATAQKNDGSDPIQGIVIDIDSIVKTHGEKFEEWFPTLENGIEKLRAANRHEFFSCLTPEALAEMEPIYEHSSD